MPPQQRTTPSEKDYWKINSKSFFYFGILSLIPLIGFMFLFRAFWKIMPLYLQVLAIVVPPIFFTAAYLFKNRAKAAIYLGWGIVSYIFISMVWSSATSFNVFTVVVSGYLVFSLGYPIYQLQKQGSTATA